jgi:exodeoxyribonuclease VII small subunit
MSQETLSFEKAFERLEQILASMNSGKIPLEDSLKLFEEAEQLMRLCSARLTMAEKKIEQLIKNRNGELVLDEAQKPKREPFGLGTSQSQAKELPF